MDKKESLSHEKIVELTVDVMKTALTQPHYQFQINDYHSVANVFEIVYNVISTLGNNKSD